LELEVIFLESGKISHIAGADMDIASNGYHMAVANSKKEDQLAELKRELSALKLTLSIVGENSEASKPLVAKRESTMKKIKQLESEVQKEKKT
jgi:hypothetical protein